MRAVAILLVLTFALVGCGAKAHAPQFHAQYYPQCYDPIDKLCKDQEHGSEVKSAAVGGLLGAIGGAVIGGLTSRDVRGALIGAAAGGVAGATIGFFKARLEKIQDRDQRLAEYQKILGENSESWDLERASVEKAYLCYGEQIRHLKMLAKKKQISREEFLARMHEIKAGIENINTYWANAQTRMDSRLADGEAFLTRQEAEDKKLAAARRHAAHRQVQAQRQNTQRQRDKKNSDVAKLNSLRDSVTQELQDTDMYFKTSKEFA
ncbi:MAG: glycine zipper 2TM domain-containing protein [Desulfovibrio sp.]|nr:glycine zipper 2TM domain-containing protein [Desulfovibrio sp.]